MLIVECCRSPGVDLKLQAKSGVIKNLPSFCFLLVKGSEALKW